jgi:hypothetical protein
MSRTDPQFNLRIPESLRDLVTAFAKRNKRSATAEILDRLEKSFTETDEIGISDLDRINPESRWYVADTDAPQVTTRVSKEKLLASADADKPVTKRDIDQAVMEAMMRALDMLDTRAGERLPDQPTKGPKPRKRYPKE